MRTADSRVLMLHSNRQNGFIVRDLRAAIEHWTRVMRVGPFALFEHADSLLGVETAPSGELSQSKEEASR